MPRLKVNDVLNFLDKEFNAPCKYKDYKNYLSHTCNLSSEDMDMCESCNSHIACWENLIKIKTDLELSGLTLDQYLETKSKPKVKRGKAPKVTTEELLAIDCWSNKLYEAAYDIVKDRLFPIVIPSYNRPENGFLKWATTIVQPGYEYPIYIVVRQSQKELYEASEYVVGRDYIHIKAFPDEMIDDIGKVRQQIVNAFSKKYDCVFMFDDDIVNFCHSVPWVRSNGEPKAQGVKSDNLGKTLAMWQIAMEYAVKKEDVVLSKGMLQGFSWVPEFIKVEHSIRYMSGLPTLAVCVNLKKLKESGLNYRTLIGNGHDDIDLLIRCLQQGLKVAEFRWMTFGSPGIGTDILHFNSVTERFTQQQAEMKNNFGDIPWIKWTHTRGLDNVGIKWNQVIEMYKEKGFADFTDKSVRETDLWRNGQLLEDAKNNYINV